MTALIYHTPETSDIRNSWFAFKPTPKSDLWNLHHIYTLC